MKKKSFKNNINLHVKLLISCKQVIEFINQLTKYIIL